MLINIIGFNAVWFGLVVWGNVFIPVALLLLGLHLYRISTFDNEPTLILFVTFIGCLVDSLLQVKGVFIFASSTHIPWWLIALWACFAATICHSLSFLSDAKWLQILVGGTMAPLSYVAGEKFNSVQFGESLIITCLVLSVIWAGLFLLFFHIKNNLIIKG